MYSVTFSSVSVQLLHRVWPFATPWTAAHQASLSITNSRTLLKLMSIESVMPSNRLILCCPLLFLPSIFPSIRVFSNESVLRIRWPKYWSFSFSISLSNEYSGLISFRMDWLDPLAVQETLKSLLQHHSSKASILWCSAFFIVQFSHPYMTTGKTIALTRWTFVGKVMFLLNILLVSLLMYSFLNNAAFDLRGLSWTTFMRAPPSFYPSSHFQRPHLLMPSPWRLGFHIWIWRDTDTNPWHYLYRLDSPSLPTHPQQLSAFFFLRKPFKMFVCISRPATLLAFSFELRLSCPRHHWNCFSDKD